MAGRLGPKVRYSTTGAYRATFLSRLDFQAKAKPKAEVAPAEEEDDDAEGEEEEDDEDSEGYDAVTKELALITKIRFQ